MAQKISLREAERRAFRVAYDDGLWDILLACFVSIFAIAPLLSPSLGDFWSSAVFLPFWGLAFLVIRLIRKHLVTPRLGVVRFGPARKSRLKRFSVALLAINAIALILGLLAALRFGTVPGQIITAILGLILLSGFSIAAYFLDFSRLYIYGLLVGLSPLVGEWLYSYRDVPNHGLPVTFGTTAGIMLLVGLAIFARLLRYTPLPTEGIPSGEARDG